MEQSEEPTAPVDTMQRLRQAILMAAVLDDVDVTPTDDGVILMAAPPIRLDWSSIERAIGSTDPVSTLGRARLVRWLRMLRAVMAHPPHDAHEQLRPVALTADHVLHPGADWVCATIEGDLLDLGLGLTQLDGYDPDAVVIVPPGLLDAIGIDPLSAWAQANDYLERMGTVAAQRLRRDPTAVLRPMGDCDVLTLLGSRALRTELAMADGVGMRGIAVPMRTRGWTDPDHVDSAFARAAALATDEDQRGLPSAVLVTASGVHLSIGRYRPSDFTLREVKTAGRHRRDEMGLRAVRYRST